MAVKVLSKLSFNFISKGAQETGSLETSLDSVSCRYRKMSCFDKIIVDFYAEVSRF